MTTTQYEDNHAIIWASQEALDTLRDRQYLTMMTTATHKTNLRGWKLFTLMVRDSNASWRPTGHVLCQTESTAMISECLKAFRDLTLRYSRQKSSWQPRYLLTGDSASEQTAVASTFLHSDTEYLLCQTQFIRAIDRHYKDAKYVATLAHIKRAVHHHTKHGCERSLHAAFEALPPEGNKIPATIGFSQDLRQPSDDDQQYFKHCIWARRALWATYPRVHTALLLQVLTIGPLEAYYLALKHGREDRMARSFTLMDTAVRCRETDDLYHGRARAKAAKFRTTLHPLATVPQIAWIRNLPGPVQTLIAGQYKQANDLPARDQLEFFDGAELLCECRFHRSYYLPCKHLFKRERDIGGVITPERVHHWTSMFEDRGYEVYETRHLMSCKQPPTDPALDDTLLQRLNQRRITRAICDKGMELHDECEDTLRQFPQVDATAFWRDFHHQMNYAFGALQRWQRQRRLQIESALGPPRHQPLHLPARMVVDEPTSAPISSSTPNGDGGASKRQKQ